jgi:hypothetical protein
MHKVVEWILMVSSSDGFDVLLAHLGYGNWWNMKGVGIQLTPLCPGVNFLKSYGFLHFVQVHSILALNFSLVLDDGINCCSRLARVSSTPIGNDELEQSLQDMSVPVNKAHNLGRSLSLRCNNILGNLQCLVGLLNLGLGRLQFRGIFSSSRAVLR